MSEQRRLAAILVADVVGYSKLVGSDEAGTLARLQMLRSDVIEPAIAKHAGRLFKAVGDGFLVEFASAVQAVEAARGIQQANTDGELQLRIGIHVGDVVVQGEDLMGDGVNIAARLEGVADPGGIALSRQVYDQVRDRLDTAFLDKGEVEPKNIARPVHVFAVTHSLPSPSGGGLGASAPAPLTLPDKPSIAVLPFQNMSGDPEQEYFTDGITEDIITELSRFHSLFVIARNSSFSYKDKSPDVRQVGRELGVRYVLEGSIRRSSDRIRVTAQLIDAITGKHIWPERYDRVLEDIFAVQEEVTGAIVAAIAPQIEATEQSKAARRRPDNLSAYEIALRAWAHALEGQDKADRTLLEQSIREAREALAIDPNSVLALHALAASHGTAFFLGVAVDREMAPQEAMLAVTRAIELDSADANGYALRAAGVWQRGQWESYPQALVDARRAYEMNPNNTFVLRILGSLEALAGEPERSIEHLQQVLRLNPRDPRIYMTHNLLASACFIAKRYADAIDWASRALRERPQLLPAHSYIVLHLVGVGEIGKAKAMFETLQKLASADYLRRGLEGKWAFGRSEDRRRATTFLRIAAGLEDPSAAEALR
jgi:adenylate cyclase